MFNGRGLDLTYYCTTFINVLHCSLSFVLNARKRLLPRLRRHRRHARLLPAQVSNTLPRVHSALSFHLCVTPEIPFEQPQRLVVKYSLFIVSSSESRSVLAWLLDTTTPGVFKWRASQPHRTRWGGILEAPSKAPDILSCPTRKHSFVVAMILLHTFRKGPTTIMS